MAHDRIEINPQIMGGKPVIRGTRIPVELLLRKLGAGLTPEAILADHPKLPAEDIRDILDRCAKPLESLMECAAEWPEEAQAELVEAMLAIETRHGGMSRLSDDERDAVRRGLQEARDGKLAGDAGAAAVFDRYRRG